LVALLRAVEFWKPIQPVEYNLTVRATDDQDRVQQFEKDRSPFSGVTGFDKITVLP
jgi:hypothetical protein